MQTYNITWTATIEADSKAQAAYKAAAGVMREDTTAVVFDVDGDPVDVPLSAARTVLECEQAGSVALAVVIAARGTRNADLLHHVQRITSSADTPTRSEILAGVIPVVVSTFVTEHGTPAGDALGKVFDDLL